MMLPLMCISTMAKLTPTSHTPMWPDAQVIRNAKLWCDVESAEEAKDLSKQWDWTLVPGFTASKILWLKNNEPENFSKLAKVLLPHDYFNYYLTGRYCMEASFSAQHVLEHIACPSTVAQSSVQRCTLHLCFMVRTTPMQSIVCTLLASPVCTNGQVTSIVPCTLVDQAARLTGANLLSLGIRLLINTRAC